MKNAPAAIDKPWLLLCWCEGILVEKRSYRALFEPGNSASAELRKELIALSAEFESVFLVDNQGVNLLHGNARFWT